MKTILNLIVGISKNRLFLLLAVILLLNGVLEAQTVTGYDYGTGSGSVNSTTGPVTGTQTTGATFFPTPTAGNFFYGFGTGSSSQLSGVNPGLLRVGTFTEAQASAGNGDTSLYFTKFGLMGFATANSKSSYTKFEIVLGGNTGTNTADNGVWYFFVGDGATSGQFMYNNQTRKNLGQTAVAIKWVFGTGGTLNTYYFSKNTSNWVLLSSSFTQCTKYTYEIYGNLATTTQYSRNGGLVTCSKDCIDIYVNNVKIANQVPVASSVNPSGGLNKLDTWCFYGEGNNQAYIFTDAAVSSGDIGTYTTYVYYSKPTGNLDVLGTWGTNTDGSGTSPSNFTSQLCTYHIQNNATPTLGAVWTVSGLDSRVILGDGTNACNFTVPTSYAFNGVIDVSNNGTLTLKNTTVPTYGNILNGSTVEYSTGASDVAYPVFYNLKFSGTASKTITTNVSATNLITIGDGTNALTVTVPPAYTMTGTTNVSSNGTLKIQNVTSPSFGTLATNSRVEYDSASSTQTTPISSVSFYNLEVDNPNGVNLGGGITVNNTLTLTSGTVNTGSQTLTFANGNTPISRNLGTITTSTGTNIVFGTAGNTGGNAFTIPTGTFSGTPSINNFTLDRTNILNLGSNFIINGLMTLTSGAFGLNGNTLTLNGTSAGTGTISGSNTSSLSIGGTGSLGTIYFTSDAQSLKAFTVNRTSSGSVTLGSDLTMDGTTDGTLTLTSGALDVSGRTLTFITGNTPIIRTNGTITTSTSSNLVFGTSGNTGGAAFTIPAGTFTSTPSINNFSLHRSNSLTLSQDLNVHGTLALTSGLLIGTNGGTDYITTLGSSTSSIGSVTVGTGRIVGKLARYISTSTSNYLFPIGSTTNDNSVNLAYSSGPTTGGTLTAKFILGNPGSNNGLNPIMDGAYTINTYSQYGYWSIINSNVVGTYNISVNAFGFPGLNTDAVKRAKVRIIKRPDNTGLWTAQGDYTQATGGQTNTVAIRSNLSSFSEFAIASNGDDNTFDGPLPVSLQSFSSSVTDRNVKLNWTTSAETNNAGFEIERVQSSEFRIQSWEKIGYVKGQGTVNTQTNYTYTDTKLNTGKYQYRLKQIDNNGNFEYHNLSGEVGVSAPKNFELSQNYPNPFNPTTKIDFTIPVDSKVNIAIYDITGKEISALVNESKAAGYYTLLFDGSKLSSGIYFYRIIVKNNIKDFSSFKKMMLIK